MRRREALGLVVLGAGPVRNVAAQSDWKPAILSEDEDRTVDRISDLILPRTSTPGAHDAKVNRYIDEMLKAGMSAAERAGFLDGLKWLGGYCAREYGRPFVELDSKQQVAVLTRMSESPANDPGRRFFARIKDLTLRGYYTSREGLLQELEYKGNQAYAEYPGCSHPEHRR